MEHAGAIFYNASGLLLDQSATQNQLLGRASVIAHETAHMWFGDLVTMRWFNDVWMKEVFANFMAAKIVNPSFPEINHELRFLFCELPGSLRRRSHAGNQCHPAAARQPGRGRQRCTARSSIRRRRSSCGSSRASSARTSFRDGLREYLRDHAFANATWSDLIALLDARTPEDLAAWSRAWVEEPGRPSDHHRRCGSRTDAIARLAFAQRDPVPGAGLNWTQRLQVVVSSAQSNARCRSDPRRPRPRPWPDAAGLPAPDFVLPTGGGIGYGGFVLDDASRAYLLRHLPEFRIR